MKRKLLLAILANVLTLNSASATQIIMLEDFEDATVNYSTSIPEFNDGDSDFFTRTDGTNIPNAVSYSNIQGSYFAAMDIDNNNNNSSQQTMTFASIDITNFTDLQFSAQFAEDDDGAKEDWDSTDFFSAEYRIDGGAYQNLLAFENDGSQSNSAPFLDTNFDGTGNSTELTDTFTSFSAAIAGTGAALDLRFTFRFNAGDEDIALDNVLVSGTEVVNSVPEPQTYALFLAGLALLGFASRRRPA